MPSNFSSNVGADADFVLDSILEIMIGIPAFGLEQRDWHRRLLEGRIDPSHMGASWQSNTIARKNCDVAEIDWWSMRLASG